MDGFGLLFILSAVLGLLPAKIAADKGRSFGVWWLYGFLLFIIAFLHSLALRPDQDVIEKEKINSGERVKCPFCAEIIKPEAIVCKHCNKDIPTTNSNNKDEFLADLSSKKFYSHKNGNYELDDSAVMMIIQGMKEIRNKLTGEEYDQFINTFNNTVSSLEDSLPEQLKEEFSERYRYWLLK